MSTRPLSYFASQVASQAFLLFTFPNLFWVVDPFEDFVPFAVATPSKEHTSANKLPGWFFLACVYLLFLDLLPRCTLEKSKLKFGVPHLSQPTS